MRRPSSGVPLIYMLIRNSLKHVARAAEGRPERAKKLNPEDENSLKHVARAAEGRPERAESLTLKDKTARSGKLQAQKLRNAQYFEYAQKLRNAQYFEYAQKLRNAQYFEYAQKLRNAQYVEYAAKHGQLSQPGKTDFKHIFAASPIRVLIRNLV